MNLQHDYQSVRLRVGVDFHAFDGIFQGSRSHILGLYSRAVVQAPDVDFYLFVGNPEALKDAWPVFHAPNVRCIEMRASSGVRRLLWDLPRLRKQHRIDMLHMQYRLPLVTGGPCAVTIHDILFEEFPQYFNRFFVYQSKFTFRDAARRADVLFSVSEYSRDQIAQRYGVEAKRIGVTPNAVDLERFSPLSVNDEVLDTYGLSRGKYILTVGRLEPRKNHTGLFRAYSQLGGDSPPLVVVGQKDFSWEGLLAEARRLGIDGRVHFLERIGDTHLPVLYAGAKLFVFPTFAEGFGMPVLEAMASGTPVVTSNTTSLPEVGGGACLLVDPSDHVALAAAMRSVLDDEAVADSLGQRGRARALELYSWESSASTLMDGIRAYFDGGNSRGG